MRNRRIRIAFGSVAIALLSFGGSGIAFAHTIGPHLVTDYTGNMNWLLSPGATDTSNGYEFTISSYENNVTAEIAQNMYSGFGTFSEEFRMVAVSGGSTSRWQTVNGTTGRTAADLIFSLPPGTYALEVRNISNSATGQGNAYVYFS